MASDNEIRDIIFSQHIKNENIICIAIIWYSSISSIISQKSSIDPKFEKINHKYPTAALAVIKIKDGNWENLYSNQNELVDLLSPKI